MTAALFMGAVCSFSSPAYGGSCCGGGGGGALVLPKYATSKVDFSVDYEKYDGFWKQDGQITPDPAGSNLSQMRLNGGYALRLSERWQASIAIPYVWNHTEYATGTTKSEGFGDTNVGFWYEALDDLSAWKIRDLKDLTPSIKIGPSVLIPTGKSPYDEGVINDTDITGRGFYRLDGNLLLEKSIQPWSLSFSFSYGEYISRPVNEEPGSKYPSPYRLKLGNRMNMSLSLSYIYYIGTGGNAITGTAALSELKEANTEVDGVENPGSGMAKKAASGTLAYSSTDHDWSVRASWNHAIRKNGWGRNFPITDIYTIGVSYVFR